MANPTNPADIPDVSKLAIDSDAAEKMMSDPMNSRRTASHRFALTRGKYARVFKSIRHSFSFINRSVCSYARIVLIPPRDS